jgi:uncharacterized cupin superfamily protein
MKIDLDKVAVKTGSIYPAPYADMMQGRSSLRLGDAGGLTQFGVNLVTLEPGAISSLRHWHLHEDEFVMITTGACTMITDQGPTLMCVGDCAAFPANTANGHHFVNHTASVAQFLVVGSKAPLEVATYSDVDLMVTVTSDAGYVATFTHKDGSPYKAGL